MRSKMAITELQRVKFVMKGGKVVKNELSPGRSRSSSFRAATVA